MRLILKTTEQKLLQAADRLASGNDGSAAFLERYRAGMAGAAQPTSAAAAKPYGASKGAAMTDKHGNLI